MRLPRPPENYDARDQAILRSVLEQNDTLAFKRGQDVQLLQGERLILGSASGLVAHAGGGQASATKMVADINHFATVATAADSGALPPAVAGRRITVINRGASSMQVFGQGSDTINGVAAGTGVAQAAGVKAIYECPVAGQWFV